MDELTANGAVLAGRLFEAPYTDIAPAGPYDLFTGGDVTVIVDTLREVDARANPVRVA